MTTQVISATIEEHYYITIPEEIDMDEHYLHEDELDFKILSDETDEVVLTIYKADKACYLKDWGIDSYVVETQGNKE